MAHTGAGRSFWAFLSYSHRDSEWAKKFHTALETYRVPRRLVGTKSFFGTPVPRRIFPVFRDEDELPTSANLGTNLYEALEASHTLVVLCSPHSAKSHWVNEEIIHFKKLGRAERVMAVILDGEPNAEDDTGTGRPECFPRALRRHVSDDGTISDERVEPLAADVRPGALPWKLAKLKIISGIIGVAFDDLRQRDQERARLGMILLATKACIIVAAFIAMALHMKDSHRRALISTALSTAARHLSERHLLHAGVELAKAATLGEPTVSLTPQLQSVARALVPQVDVIPSASRTIESAAFSPDGRYLAVTGADGRLSVWDLRPSGSVLATRLYTGNRAGSQVTFHPSGTQVAASIWDGTVRLWSISTAAPPLKLEGHVPKVRLNDVDISRDGKWMLTGGDDTFARLWDASEWKTVGAGLSEHGDLVKSARFSTDGTLAVTSGYDGVLRVLHIPDGSKIAEISVKDQINRALITLDNRFVIAGGRTGVVWIADIAEKRLVKTIDRAHANRINDLALHPDKKCFFSAGDDGYARRWSLQDGSLLMSIEDHAPLNPDPASAAVKILAIAISRDGLLAATASDKGNVKLWNLAPPQAGSSASLLSEVEHRIKRAFSATP